MWVFLSKISKQIATTQKSFHSPRVSFNFQDSWLHCIVYTCIITLYIFREIPHTTINYVNWIWTISYITQLECIHHNLTTRNHLRFDGVVKSPRVQKKAYCHQQPHKDLIQDQLNFEGFSDLNFDMLKFCYFLPDLNGQVSCHSLTFTTYTGFQSWKNKRLPKIKENIQCKSAEKIRKIGIWWPDIQCLPILE